MARPGCGPAAAAGAPTFPPETVEGSLVGAHDDPGVGSADKGPTVDTLIGANFRGACTRKPFMRLCCVFC